MSTLKVHSPYDGQIIKEIPLSDRGNAEEALHRARTLFDDRSRWLSKEERIAILGRFGHLLEINSNSLARQSAHEGGKPLADSIVEIKRAINGVEIAIREISALGGREIPMGINASSQGHIAYTMIEPTGPVLAISAFNHPMNLIIHQAIPAIAAGCPVIVKPSQATPLSCISIIELLYEAGLPRDWCACIVCPDDVAAAMAADTRIAFVTFIGSARVGWKIRSSLAPGVRCALEHGGAAPVIIEPDADLDAIMPGIIKGAYYHAGQVCVSVQRAFVHKSISGKFISRAVQMAQALTVGDPLKESTEVGPLIRTSEVDRVEQWVNEAVEAGARLASGGSRISDSCYAPTLLVNPPMDAKVSSEEIFGPVLCVYEYEDYLTAVSLANALPYTFQAAVFTKNIDVALDCVKRLKGTAVLVNEHTAFRVDWMPFGGAEHSGLGIGGIGYSMRDMSCEKLMIIKSRSL